MKMKLLVFIGIGCHAFAAEQEIYQAHLLQQKMDALYQHRFSLQQVWQNAKEAFVQSLAYVTTGLDTLTTSSLDAVMTPFRELYNADNPYKVTPAKVRFGNDLCQEEQQFLRQRRYKVAHAQTKLLGSTVDPVKPLHIALCGSGGGNRAMVYMLGSLIGAKKIGLLDSTTYVSCLSGSTWTVGAWLAQGVPLQRIRDVMKERIQRHLVVGGRTMIAPITEYDEIDKVVNNCIRRFIFNQPLSIVAIWGALVANMVLYDLGEQRQLVGLSSQRLTVGTGSYPLPIYTAIEPVDHLDPDKPEYHWFEFTPYEVGSAAYQAFTPTWAFGRKFKQGVTTGYKVRSALEYEPEMPLGYLLGVFGSAFEVDIYELMKNMGSAIENNPLAQEIISLLLKTTTGNERLMPAEVKNHVYRVAGHPFEEKQHITLVDAGLSANVPTQPLLRPERAVDVIFVIDASANIERGEELAKAERLAHRQGYAFPKIDYSGIGERSISIFGADDPTVPTVVYMPWIADKEVAYTSHYLAGFDAQACVKESYCNTFNFAYTADRFEQLCCLGQENMERNKEKIIGVLQKVWKKKQNRLLLSVQQRQ